jgi:seryl-tRNA synthetase
MKHIATQYELNFERNDNADFINQNVKFHIPDRKELEDKILDLYAKLASKDRTINQLKIEQDKFVKRIQNQDCLIYEARTILDKVGIKVCDFEYDEEYARDFIEIIQDAANQLKFYKEKRGHYSI